MRSRLEDSPQTRLPLSRCRFSVEGRWRLMLAAVFENPKVCVSLTCNCESTDVPWARYISDSLLRDTDYATTENQTCRLPNAHLVRTDPSVHRSGSQIRPTVCGRHSSAVPKYRGQYVDRCCNR